MLEWFVVIGNKPLEHSLVLTREFSNVEMCIRPCSIVLFETSIVKNESLEIS